MQNRIYETVERPTARLSVRLSIYLSNRTTAATAAGGFTAERHAGLRYRSIASVGAQQQIQAASR